MFVVLIMFLFSLRVLRRVVGPMGVLFFMVKQGHQVVVPACHTDFKLALTHHQLHILLKI